MFKSSSFEEELVGSMQKILISNSVENKKGFNKLAKVFDLLKTASDIFDDAGMTEESKNIEEVLNVLANKFK